jgi:hypothetical protein
VLRGVPPPPPPPGQPAKPHIALLPAAAAGGEVVSEDLGHKLEKVEMEMLGSCKKVGGSWRAAAWLGGVVRAASVLHADHACSLLPRWRLLLQIFPEGWRRSAAADSTSAAGCELGWACCTPWTMAASPRDGRGSFITRGLTPPPPPLALTGDHH